ncbi:MAG: sigma 54-interacting transcriptional regulator [Peptococcaceae bacterium]|nr:sigma 54-interacting transcriptional regulator [Peptococcaceae bacterium]
MQKKSRLLLIGRFSQQLEVLRGLKLVHDVELAAVLDPSAKNEEVLWFQESPVPVYCSSLSLMEASRPDFDLIIDTLGLTDTLDYLEMARSSGSLVYDSRQSEFLAPVFVRLVKNEQKYRQAEAAMEAAQEGIEVVDENGIITYVNAAFTKILNVPAKDRLGFSVFEVSPDGSLAEVLRTGKAVFGNNHVTNGKTIIANASPLINDGRLVGAVTVFNDANLVEKMIQILDRSKEEIASLKEEIHSMNQPKYSFMDLVGEAPNFKKCVSQAKQAADSMSTVLITGESGTGKELFSHGIHEFGCRAKGPFIKVNCPAIPGTLLESELFGYEKGAFTGAVKTKMGKFELANGGTIFLDEIGDMDLYLQAKLLRVLQEKEVERVGGVHPIRVDVRVIAATNKNLKESVEKGQFRSDLYYRLNVIHIHLPPLRERRGDIPLLARQMIRKYCERDWYERKTFPTRVLREAGGRINGMEPLSENQIPRLDAGAIQELRDYEWPGNIRELENLVEKLMIMGDDSLITREDVVSVLYPAETVPLEQLEGKSISAMEKRMILASLKRHGETLEGKKAAAKELGISLTCLYDKLKKYR